MCCSSLSAAVLEDRGEGSSSLPSKRPQGCCQSSPKRRSKRLNRQSPKENPEKTSADPILLPPIVTSPLMHIADPASSPPTFPDIPPISSIVQLAGSGCTCGFDCSCPGCVEHRGKENTSSEHDDCADSCGTCVDNQHGLELPQSTPFGTVPSKRTGQGPDFLEAFFAKAASIPPPPRERANARTLDPTNVTIYPPSLFIEPNALDERGPAFGLVRLPKLECCSGRCGCPSDNCGCGTSCEGCCSEESQDVRSPSRSEHVVHAEDSAAIPRVEASQEARSCCSG